MRKFYRSRNNRMISGLCGGLGELTNVDVTLYRILLVVLTFFTNGALILVYLIVSLVVPKAPDIFNPYQNQNGFGGPNGYNGGQGGSGGFNGGQGGQGGFGGPGQYNNGRGSFNNNPNQTQHTSQRQWQAPPHQTPHTPPTQQNTSNIDSMMDDLEKKALRKEIEQLKQKLNEVKKKGE